MVNCVERTKDVQLTRRQGPRIAQHNIRRSVLLLCGAVRKYRVAVESRVHNSSASLEYLTRELVLIVELIVNPRQVLVGTSAGGLFLLRRSTARGSERYVLQRIHCNGIKLVW